MCVKATSAFIAMAAAAEERPASNPSRDTVDAIDDAISVAVKVSFFGRTTKSVKGKGDNIMQVILYYSGLLFLPR